MIYKSAKVLFGFVWNKNSFAIDTKQSSIERVGLI